MSSNKEKMYDTSDHSTLSNYNEVVSTNIRLEWKVDFEKKVFSGYADQTVKVLVTGTTVASFDSAKLHVEAVTIDSEIVSFTSADPHPVLGTKISVDIPEKYRTAGSTFVIRFKYSTDPAATAVQWLPETATKGGKHPYVFTQCQAIHARSLLPCMDSPGVKTQYQAVVTAPTWAKVLMSALEKQESSSSNDEYSTFSFHQPVPTSAYLIALAAGNLASRDISPRVRVWSEPEEVEAVNFEFSETEEFLTAAEEITGCPYVWTRYDVLCLPPSFPFGGMENPCLTFATPTLLAGDRSLADVIAHEIAHSWTGNLVTNHTWSHFWLNEGWTVWLERKITAKVKKSEEVAKLSAQIGLKDLIESIEDLGKENVFTRLVWPLNDDDPDDAFSSVPYEKGFNLLNYLERIVGTDHFEAFAQAYVQEFKYKTVTTGAFRDLFVQFITQRLMIKDTPTQASSNSAKKNKKKKGKNNNNTSNTNGNNKTITSPADDTAQIIADANKEILKQVEALNWDELFFSVGDLPYIPDFANSLSQAAELLASEWNEYAVDATFQFDKSVPTDISNWSSQQIAIFLEELLDNYPIPLPVIEKLDALYHFTDRGNAEIKLRWQTLALKSGAPWIVPHVIAFITSQGRMKFVRPLYRALSSSSVGGRIAATTFEEYKDFYHPICRKMLEIDLERFESIWAEHEAELAAELAEQADAEAAKEEQQQADDAEVATTTDAAAAEITTVEDTVDNTTTATTTSASPTKNEYVVVENTEADEEPASTAATTTTADAVPVEVESTTETVDEPVTEIVVEPLAETVDEPMAETVVEAVVQETLQEDTTTTATTAATADESTVEVAVEEEVAAKEDTIVVETIAPVPAAVSEEVKEEVEVPAAFTTETEITTITNSEEESVDSTSVSVSTTEEESVTPETETQETESKQKEVAAVKEVEVVVKEVVREEEEVVKELEEVKVVKEEEVVVKKSTPVASTVTTTNDLVLTPTEVSPTTTISTTTTTAPQSTPVKETTSAKVAVTSSASAKASTTTTTATTAVTTTTSTAVATPVEVKVAPTPPAPRSKVTTTTTTTTTNKPTATAVSTYTNSYFTIATVAAAVSLGALFYFLRGRK